MNLAQTLRRLLRRWYILLLGLLLAAGAVVGVWMKVPPRFERSSTQVLLPGQASLPRGGGNPYLFIGGLTLAADVVVRAIGSENVVKELEVAHPGIEIAVTRDPTTAGPVILITVGASSDDEAAVILQLLTHRTATVLRELQRDEAIPAKEQMTIVTVTMDEHGTLKDRTRLILSVAAGAGVIALSVLVAALVEGLSGRRGRRRATVKEAPDLGGSEDAESEPDIGPYQRIQDELDIDRGPEIAPAEAPSRGASKQAGQEDAEAQPNHDSAANDTPSGDVENAQEAARGSDPAARATAPVDGDRLL